MDDVHVNFRNLLVQHCIQQVSVTSWLMLQVACVHSYGQWVIGMEVSIIQSWSSSDIFPLFVSPLFTLISVICI